MADIPNPKTWTAGLWSAAEMNREMRDTLQFFLNPPICIIRKEDQPQDVRNGVLNVPINWDVVVYDNDSCFSTSDRTRLTVQTSGYYLINGQFQWYIFQSLPDDVRLNYARVFNADGSEQQQVWIHNNEYGTSITSYSGSTVIPMNAGQYLIFYAGKWTGAIGDQEDSIVGYDTANGFYGCQASIRWVSAL